MSSVFGTHLIFDMAGVMSQRMDDISYIREFIDELVDALDMQKLGVMHAEWLEEPLHLRGWSICQMIHTSSIVAHICSNQRAIYLDVFSCGQVVESVVKQVCTRYWQPRKCRQHTIYRDERLCRDNV